MMSGAFSADGADGSGGGPGGGGQGGCPGFLQNVFSLIDTNYTALTDTNLYHELLLFPNDSNTGPDLQVMFYRPNILLLKANHFDYSADTRDFALVICDSVATPLWKNIDLSTAVPAQDGWLVARLCAQLEGFRPNVFNDFKHLAEL